MMKLTEDEEEEEEQHEEEGSGGVEGICREGCMIRVVGSALGRCSHDKRGRGMLQEAYLLGAGITKGCSDAGMCVWKPRADVDPSLEI
jgi:hypothetical protein